MASSTGQTSRGAFKRIIVCCDGTWKNALGKDGAGSPPSNVTRISRALRNTCTEAGDPEHPFTHQVIMYHPGVGSSGQLLDSSIGGTFGLGLDEDIRELYNFVATNYVDGDDIILLGFSRGAFTARSVADLIASVGLLTMEGLDHFYDIFEDYENMGDGRRDVDEFLFSELEPYRGETGKARILWENERKTQYRNWLKQMGYTRDTYMDGVTEIRIKAIGVWETVGCLGIPAAPVIGLQGSAKEWKFTNTQISDKVENAFQALGLDEPRYDFRPALWERVGDNRTNLKQVWFPGSHSNIGGGWYDQQIADITLAWMCDQLSSVGVEFDFARLNTIFTNGLRYSAAHPFPYVPSHKPLGKLLQPRPIPWATKGIFPAAVEGGLRRDTADCSGKERHPSGTPRQLWRTARPWALGQTRYPTSLLQLAAGKTVRRPGLAMRVDPETNEDTDDPLLGTGERIHSSVRVRLACGGLGMDDKEVWKCEALTTYDSPGGDFPLWRLERSAAAPSPRAAAEEAAALSAVRELRLDDAEYPKSVLYPLDEEAGQWRWVFARDVSDEGNGQVPQATVLPEEPLLGYWERFLLGMRVGDPDVWKWASKSPPEVTATT